MRNFLYFMARLGVAIPLALLTWIIAVFFVDLNIMLAGLFGLLGGLIPFYIIKWFQKRAMLKDYNLSSQEYQYIQQNLKEGQKKISTLQNRMFQVRSLSAMRQLNDMVKLSKRIFVLVKKDPNRFYVSERFFFYHLDSAVELTDKYTMLVTQPIKNKEILMSLEDTKKTLHDLNSSLEEELMKVLANDINSLQVELDVAKKSLRAERLERSREGI
ncbi:protein xpaC [Jeotgalibacillus sp. S-D1]|uniref:5-bromo-4-chloroindolyl phosphate hydrolysis family protein n=1 Tax=Jeotgalibacillus sp. S-D1 TaxID=2552189 RepID=UPI001059826C|nr:5-bromo-4-chloroindolyl phosphate hydrolysis family protein [Jeotgalibacillus sp. S-D1]TDL34869.1 protein xpaC [Jeotgalibacillus sp. S-D1]